MKETWVLSGSGIRVWGSIHSGTTSMPICIEDPVSSSSFGLDFGRWIVIFKAMPLHADSNLSFKDCPHEVDQDLQLNYRVLVDFLMFLYHRLPVDKARYWIWFFFFSISLEWSMDRAQNILVYMKGTQDYGINYTRYFNRLYIRRTLNPKHSNWSIRFWVCSL